MIAKTIAAIFGTIAFALLFGVPKKYYPYCGAIGGLVWLLYSVLQDAGLSVTESTVLAGAAVALSSRICAVYCGCPVTVFLVSGLFPLVPGAGIYRTAYYLVRGEKSIAMNCGYDALCVVIAIVLGIVIVLELPNRLFEGLKRRRKTT